MVEQYWEDLLREWQDLNYDVGGIILQHVHVLMVHKEKIKKLNHEFNTRIKEVCCTGQRRVQKKTFQGCVLPRRILTQ